MVEIASPRPPLNIFNVKRAGLSGTSWVEVHKTPKYIIPAVGPNPARTVKVVSLLTSLIVTNPGSAAIQVSLRIRDASNNTWTVLNSLPVPPNDFALIELGKQNLPSDESIEARVGDGQNAIVHLSFVENQREEFEVV